MRYTNIKELPDIIRKLLPNEEIEKVYLAAYNESWDSYNEQEGTGHLDREVVAHRDGWDAVQREYMHDNDTGTWYHKGEERPVAAKEEHHSLLSKLRELI